MKNLLVLWALCSGSAAPLYADVASDLRSMIHPESQGAAAVTSGELAAFTTQAASYTAQEAIRGIAVYQAIETVVVSTEGTDPSTSDRILRALRAQVKGLATPISRFPGLSFASCGYGCAALRYHSLSDIAALSLVYTLNDWKDSHVLDFQSIDPRNWRAEIFDPRIDDDPSLIYAVRITGRDGRQNWFNNPRENRSVVGAFHLNFVYPLSGLDREGQELGMNPYLALLDSYTFPESDAQETITMNEFSSLVEQLTFVGGGDLYTWSIPSSLSRRLAELQVSGVSFEDGVYESMQSFMHQALQGLLWATYPQVQTVLLPSGQAALRFFESNLRGMELTFSSDGWNTVWTQSCQAELGAWVCPLGAVPPGVMLAYRPRFLSRSGGESRPTVNGNHPFFHELILR